MFAEQMLATHDCWVDHPHAHDNQSFVTSQVSQSNGDMTSPNWVLKNPTSILKYISTSAWSFSFHVNTSAFVGIYFTSGFLNRVYPVLSLVGGSLLGPIS
jgi:hypothetical protein